MTPFPRAETEDRFEALTAAELLPAVTRLVARLGHDGAAVVKFTEGSLPVYAVGDSLVLKLYPPVYAGEAAVEAGVLRALTGRLDIPTPTVRETGERDGWGYLLMTRLPGEGLHTAWPALSTSDRERLADRLGATLATLHSTRDPIMDALEPKDWQAWISGQRESAVRRQRAAGTGEHWIERIPAFLDSVDLGRPSTVLLHTECMREHLMVRRHHGAWHACGLLDFEPAMRGAAEYDFAAVGLFVSRGDAPFLRRLLLAYGYPADRLDAAFARRCLAYTLLHRYANLRRYLSVLPAPAEPTLDSLALAWWGTGA